MVWYDSRWTFTSLLGQYWHSSSFYVPSPNAPSIYHVASSADILASSAHRTSKLQSLKLSVWTAKHQTWYNLHFLMQRPHKGWKVLHLYLLPSQPEYCIFHYIHILVNKNIWKLWKWERMIPMKDSLCSYI